MPYLNSLEFQAFLQDHYLVSTAGEQRQRKGEMSALKEKNNETYFHQESEILWKRREGGEKAGGAH